MALRPPVLSTTGPSTPSPHLFGLAEAPLILVVISQQFSQDEQLHARCRLEFQAHGDAPFGFVAHPDDLRRDGQGFPEDRCRQGKFRLISRFEAGGAANPCSSHAQIHERALDELPRLRVRNLGRQVYAVALFAAEMVEARHFGKASTGITPPGVG